MRLELKANDASDIIPTIGNKIVELGVSKGCVAIRLYPLQGGYETTVFVCAKSSKNFDIPQFYQIQFICNVDSEFTYYLK